MESIAQNQEYQEYRVTTQLEDDFEIDIAKLDETDMSDEIGQITSNDTVQSPEKSESESTLIRRSNIAEKKNLTFLKY